MIVALENGLYRLVTQSDHAFLSSEILALWRAPELSLNARRDELIFAAREHDNGWREEDAAPRCDGAGRPVDFIAMPAAERQALWDRGTERWAGRRPYAALLIARHARELHRQRRREPLWRPFVRRVAERERQLRRQLAVAGRRVAFDYRLLDDADRISLAACSGHRGQIALRGLAGDITADGTVRLAPLPLAGATTFRVACRRIPQRPYRGDADLGSELAAARWQTLTVRLAGAD